MLYFDSCCEIGPRNQKDPAAPWSTEDILGWMDLCGIAGALVVHTLSIESDPVRARERLREETGKAPGRLFPVWVILPPDAGDFEGTPAELLSAMSDAGVRAVKLFPASHAFPLSLEVMGPTLEMLGKNGILTMINWGELPGSPTAAFDTLSRILAGQPDLPLLIQKVPWRAQRTVSALMERHENLHVELSAYQANRVIEVYTERFGPERLLFGTGLPEMSAGAARAFVDYAQVPRDAKEKIAGWNLVRLLGGTAPDAAPPIEDDPLRVAASQGLPIDRPISDAHCHVLPEGADGGGAYVMYNGDADGLLELADGMGIDRTALMSWDGPIASDFRHGNEVVVEAVVRHPERFLGVAYVNPVYSSRKELLTDLKRYVGELGFAGLKPYCRAGLGYDDERYAPCWEFADAEGLFVLLHTTGTKARNSAVSGLAEKYPNVQWVIVHAGSSFDFAREVAAIMGNHGNVWAELTYSTVTNGLIEWLAAEAGDERILFGTDAPMRDPRPQFGWVVWADLPAESRLRILGENFRRLTASRRGKE